MKLGAGCIVTYGFVSLSTAARLDLFPDVFNASRREMGNYAVTFDLEYM